MSSKSYSEQWRKKRKKRKRNNNKHVKHEQQQNDNDENDPLQSQDLLAESDHEEEEEQEQHEPIPQQEEEPVNTTVDVEMDDVPENNNNNRDSNNNGQDPNAQEEPHVHDDDHVSPSTTMNNNSSLGGVTNNPTHDNNERVKTLLSQALVDLTATQQECAHLQQALAASQQQCQQLQQALAQSQEKCNLYHAKYSSLKQKFYKWYHHCLKEWAAKLYRGETQDLPPDGGMSPQSSSSSSALRSSDEEESSVTSILQPRNILPVLGNNNNETTMASVTPSPFLQQKQQAQQPDEKVQPKRLSTDLQRATMQQQQHVKENVENTATVKGDYRKSAADSSTRRDVLADDGKALQQLDAPTAAANASVGETNNESDDESIHSEASETQLDGVPAKDDGDEACPDDNNDETQLESRSSLSSTAATGAIDSSPSKSEAVESSSQAWQNEETQLEGFGGGGGSSSRERTSSSLDAPRTAESSTRNRARTRSSPVSSSLPADNALATNDDDDSMSSHREKREQLRVKSASLPRRINVISAVNENQESQVSQAFLSQQSAATPPKVARKKPTSASTSSKDRASAKNASALRAMQGWTSNVTARAFVGNMTKPPAKKKQRMMSSESSLPAAAAVPSKTASVRKSNMMPQPEPRNPYAGSSKKPLSDKRAGRPNSTAKRGTRTEWSDDDDDDDARPKPFKYQEVVRCRHDRQQLPGHCCSECASFVNAVRVSKEGAQCFDQKEFLGMSRHRARHTPPSTPPGFWELSFADEKLAEEQQNQDSLYF